MLEWGDNFSGGPNSKLVRLDYHGTRERPPIARATASPTSGSVPLTVAFNTEGSHDANGDALTYRWDMNGDGTADAQGPTPRFTYRTAGQHTARLTVTDATGRTATSGIIVLAGNTSPTVDIKWPLEGGIVELGALVDYRVAVTDAEDKTVDPTRAVVTPHLGRDSHALPLPAKAGLEGTVRIARTAHYNPRENLFATLDVQYADRGTVDAPSATARTSITLQPRVKQAEYTGVMRRMPRETLEGARTVLSAETDSAFAAYGPVNLRNINALTIHVAPEAGGRIELRQDAPDGPLLGQAIVEPRSASSTPEGEDPPRVGLAASDWTDVRVPVTDPGVPHTLYVVVRGAGEEALMKVDWLRFEGPGMMMQRGASGG
jgi:PKD repeat protein